ncbi:MAG TPA: ADYC domain-containing protein [Anaeromyxobacteraceae bacterium]|nr:ADYC domain-containing protein [Anaeromyxobacteraceae bacterium]
MEVDAELDNGTEFVARTASGTRRGMEFVGAELNGFDDQGNPVVLRIESIEASGRLGYEDILAYVVSTAPAGSSPRAPLCGVDARGRPIRAIPLAGRWERGSGRETGGRWVPAPGSFTFACEGAALAKCVYLGYRPWAGKVRHCTDSDHCRETTLADLHQACVRMLRADYCGDGTPHTVDGTIIGYRDGFGILRGVEEWPFEAEWGPSGAVCISRTRLLELPEPSCIERLRKPGCGSLSHFDGGTLIMNTVRPALPK